jgi:hypothetical protein
MKIVVAILQSRLVVDVPSGHPLFRLTASVSFLVLRKTIPFRLFYDILIKNPLVTSARAMKKQTERVAVDVYTSGSPFADLEQKKIGHELQQPALQLPFLFCPVRMPNECHLFVKCSLEL